MLFKKIIFVPILKKKNKNAEPFNSSNSIEQGGNVDIQNIIP